MSAHLHSIGHLDHALFYAGLGWSVVPVHRSVRLADGQLSCTCREGSACVSPGKHPAPSSWLQYQKKAAGENQIRAWFEGQFKGYGVGIITGAVSGIFVVDVDEGPGKSGSDTLSDLQMIHSDLPETVEARTGGGGRHLIFAHPGDVSIKTGRNVLGPGVDTRGDGGFIVVAPSLHESGRLYLWNEHNHPKTTPLATAPTWLVDLSKSDADSPAATGPRDRGPEGSGEIIRDAWGKVIDGRERHMVGVICGVIASYARDHRCLPSPERVFEEAWPTYERTTKARGANLDADQRGTALMRNRIGNMLRRAQSGRWGVLESVRGEEQHSSDPEADSKAEEPDPEIFGTLGIDDLVSMDPVEWLIEGILTADGFGVTYGPPASLKSFLVLAWALSIASGQAWMGKPVKAGGVLYVAGEGVRGMGRRVRAWLKHNGLEGTDLPFRLLPASVDLTQPDQVAKLIKTAKAAASLEGVKIRFVVIDTVARSIPGADENSAQDMGRFVSAIEKIRQDVGGHVHGVHHSGKDSERGARGSTALLGGVDTMIAVKREEDRLTVRIEKQKDEDEGDPVHLLTEKVDLTAGLKVENSLVLVTDEEHGSRDDSQTSRPVALSKVASQGLQMFQRALAKEGALMTGNDYPANTHAVTVDQWRREFYAGVIVNSKPGKESDARRQAFHRANQELLEKRILATFNNLVWSVRKGHEA